MMQQLGKDKIYFVSGIALAYTHITEEAGRGMGQKRGISALLTCGHLVRDPFGEVST
jgi:hypothetical protein